MIPQLVAISDDSNNNSLIDNNGQNIHINPRQNQPHVQGQASLPQRHRGIARGRPPARGRGRGRVRPCRGNPRGGQQAVIPWDWQKIGPDDVFEPADVAMTAQERILVRMPQNPTPYDFFKLYINDEMLNIITEETNRAAKQFYEANRDQIEDGEVPFTWNCLEMEDLNTFLGLLLLMGIIYLPALHLYWSED